MTATRIDEILQSVANGGNIEDAAVELRTLMWQRNDLRFAIRYIRAAVTPPVMDNAIEAVRAMCENITKGPQLIAAAPDMLAILEEILPEIECRCDEAYTGRGRHESNSLCHYAEAVKAAIAKATGEEVQP